MKRVSPLEAAAKRAAFVILNVPTLILSQFGIDYSWVAKRRTKPTARRDTIVELLVEPVESPRCADCVLKDPKAIASLGPYLGIDAAAGSRSDFADALRVGRPLCPPECSGSGCTRLEMGAVDPAASLAPFAEVAGPSRLPEILRNGHSFGVGVRLLKTAVTDAGPLVGFICPPFSLRNGGQYVVRRHIEVLRAHGVNAVAIAEDGQDESFPVVSPNRALGIEFDLVVGTFMETLLTENASRLGRRVALLLQGYEPIFYDHSNSLLRRTAAKLNSLLHNENIQIITVSRWLEQLLLDGYGRVSTYLANGVDMQTFSLRDQGKAEKGRHRVVVDFSAGDQWYKNVEFAANVASKLARSDVEVSVLANQRYPQLSRFLRLVPGAELHVGLNAAEVANLFRSSDALFRAGLIESFSYPLAEMMATGGLAFAVDAPGVLELFPSGTADLLIPMASTATAAAQQVLSVLKDNDRAESLRRQCHDAIRERAWERIELPIVNAYKGVANGRR